ncbi:hypothetical protein [Metallosphaera sedula]|uniref:hypothetical protein n=1 Tax=Metallosphaera sedula TaxID=43687 RepID=UPI0020BDD17A|nr:hypothetical protein [Metallosphaera sedula]BBL48322.1 hypothetical protein MJ1HA_2444 [Metallosphaera sedula]
MNEVRMKLPEKYYRAIEILAKRKEISVTDMAKLLLIDQIEEEFYLERHFGGHDGEED